MAEKIIFTHYFLKFFALISRIIVTHEAVLNTYGKLVTYRNIF